MTEMDWAQAADLHSLGGEIDTPFKRGGKVSGGTLAQVVKLVMTEPRNEQWRYSITTNEHLYGSADIQELSERPDYAG